MSVVSQFSLIILKLLTLKSFAYHITVKRREINVFLSAENNIIWVVYRDRETTTAFMKVTSWRQHDRWPLHCCGHCRDKSSPLLSQTGHLPILCFHNQSLLHLLFAKKQCNYLIQFLFLTKIIDTCIFKEHQFKY